MVFRLITAPIRVLLTAVGFLLGSLFLILTLAITEVVGVYYYLRYMRPDALNRLLDGDSTVTDLIEILLSVDVIVVMLGLVVVNILLIYLTEVTESGMGGE